MVQDLLVFIVMAWFWIRHNLTSRVLIKALIVIFFIGSTAIAGDYRIPKDETKWPPWLHARLSQSLLWPFLRSYTELRDWGLPIVRISRTSFYIVDRRCFTKTPEKNIVIGIAVTQKDSKMAFFRSEWKSTRTASDQRVFNPVHIHPLEVGRPKEVLGLKEHCDVFRGTLISSTQEKALELEEYYKFTTLLYTVKRLGEWESQMTHQGNEVGLMRETPNLTDGPTSENKQDFEFVLQGKKGMSTALLRINELVIGGDREFLIDEVYLSRRFLDDPNLDETRSSNSNILPIDRNSQKPESLINSTTDNSQEPSENLHSIKESK